MNNDETPVLLKTRTMMYKDFSYALKYDLTKLFELANIENVKISILRQNAVKVLLYALFGDRRNRFLLCAIFHCGFFCLLIIHSVW